MKKRPLTRLSKVGYLDTTLHSMDALSTVGVELTPKVSVNHREIMNYFGINDSDVRSSFSMDAYPTMFTTPSNATPVQFLQYWSKKPVEGLTTANMMDEIIPRSVGGSFAQEEIIVPINERQGYASPYSDQADSPSANFNQNHIVNNIVRFETSYEVGILEEEQRSFQGLNIRNEKAEATAQVLANTLEIVGFNGYKETTTRAVYGLLNAPNLPAYTAVSTGAGGATQWSTKTIEEILNDINTAVGALMNSGKGHIRRDAKLHMAISLSVYNELGRVNSFGLEGFEKLERMFPNIKVIPTPYLDQANGANNVFYMFCMENNKEAFEYFVPEAYRLMAQQMTTTGFKERFACATAGVVFERGWACVRFTGV